MSSAATWFSLEKRYASQGQNRILQLHSELLCTMRGDLSISDSLDKINDVADNLTLIGNPVSDTDLVSIIMINIGAVYETTVSSAQARDTSISYDALKALLLSAERSRGHAGNFTGGGRGMSSRGVFSGRNAPSSSSHFHNGCSGPRISFILGPGPSNAASSSSNSGFSTVNQPSCQICGEAGHSALDCYNRMNLAYEGRV
ncbi:hypothetical protein M0R45_019327 [Rubus argutus]|uniref:CCHC-type domain-containing protein n=1 Tax=Rubus argutus TaxID=59490 RepID=A0AAW1X5S0_RUBAR